MSILKDNALAGLRKARAELAAIPKAKLNYSVLNTWLESSRGAILAAGQVSQSLADAWNGLPPLLNHAQTTDPIVLDAVRDELIGNLDRTASRVEGTQTVRPVLDALILKVKDAKLATLLNEFNAAKDHQPNLAAIGFRTILGMLIVEIAKKRKPASKLAARDDYALKPIIEDALASDLFDDGEKRMVERFFGKGAKDMFDIVAHKPGEKSLVDKSDLSGAVDNLLNYLLKAL